MLIQKAIDRLHRLPAHVQIDWLDLTWRQCARRAIDGKTRGGREVRIVQRLGQWLKHEDVLWQADAHAIVLNVLPDLVLVGKPDNPKSLAVLLYEIGNLHEPVQIEGEWIIAPADGPIEAAFAQAGVAFDLQTRRFEPTCRSTVQLIVPPQIPIDRRTG
ncbi:MAG: hypothetical protein JO353_03290 [Phycisphaerae bacterium]|nr:hypothetical protein [Phycisphaerae bacterium]